MSETAPDYLSMSDEEFAALPESAFDAPVADGEELEESQEAAAPEAQQADADADEGDDDAGTDADLGEAEEGTEAPGDQGDGDPDDSGDSDSDTDPGSDTDSVDSGDDTSGDDQPDEKSEEVDYKAVYERLTSPFQANGREMKIENVDDAIKLMQMGANYNKKMAGLKPSLKILKTLEKAGIDENKLNYLIDLENKDPAAIARLVKESGIDPLDIKPDDGDGYTAKNHSASDTEMALDEVVSEIADSPHYNATLELVAQKWDDVSRQAVVDSPQLLKVINDHMASGVYNLISTELERERMFGRLSGMSSLEAYKSVGDAIEARGGFAHLFQPKQVVPTPPPVVTNPDKTADDAKRKDKKRAASPPKAAPVAAQAAEFNPLALSDEEFAKQFDSKYA